MDFDLSDLSHSYPFLDLSRKLRVPYETVLLVADKIDKGEGDLFRSTSVWHVCRAPWRWQYPPQGVGL
jgi:hypothetical protein